MAERERLVRAPGAPVRLLAGGGLSNPDPRVLRALTTPPIGQFDPAFTAIMDDVSELGRRAFEAPSARCVPVSGLPRAALEAVLNTLLEPGDRLVVGGAGRFGDFVAGVAAPYGARVEILAVEPGGVLGAHALASSLAREPARLVAVAQVDPTTGALQPLPELADVCGALGALLLVDATHSLGGCELRFDGWGIDVAVAGLESCLAGPAGLSPVAYAKSVEAAFHARRAPPTTSYLDLLQLEAYWSPERLNHHTAPTSLVYGAREALRLALVDGPEARWERQRRVGSALSAGLAALGLGLRAQPEHRSPVLCVLEPTEDFSEVRRMLRDEYGIALGAEGQVGLVGHNARSDALLALLGALEQVLLALGHSVHYGAARAAALEVM